MVDAITNALNNGGSQSKCQQFKMEKIVSNWITCRKFGVNFLFLQTTKKGEEERASRRKKSTHVRKKWAKGIYAWLGFNFHVLFFSFLRRKTSNGWTFRAFLYIVEGWDCMGEQYLQWKLLLKMLTKPALISFFKKSC